MSEREDAPSDFERVQMALDFGADNTPALTREPVYVWTNADAALARIQAHVEALEGALRKIADRTGDSAGMTTVAPESVAIGRIARAALAGETEEVRHG